MHWKFPSLEPQKIAKIINQIDLPESIASILIQRKINEPQLIKDFLSPSLSQLFDPFLMKDMDIAVSRIIQNIKKDIPIFILGDYDVDGTSAVSLLSLGISKLGGKVVPYIPNRKREGHGLSHEALETAVNSKADLLITCDCGINDIKEIKSANDLSLDVIITDHHIPSDKLPNAYAILNPKQNDCEYPFKNLCGSGLAFKLISALIERLNEKRFSAQDFIDIAALGTSADLVPLESENRVIVHYGLRSMQKSKRLGMQLLLKAGNVKEPMTLSVSKINFQISPLINAAGRLGDANLVVKLLITNDVNEGSKIINALDKENKKRQVIQSQVMIEAVKRATTISDNNKVILMEADGWHPGVIGIIAARIKSKFKRPTIIITFDPDGNGNGSARSLNDFNIYDALSEVKDHLISFGGHPQAAGFTLHKNKFNSFKNSLLKHTDKMSFNNVSRELELDGCLNLSEIDYAFVKLIQCLAPFGPGNPVPKFALKRLEIIGNPLIIGNGSHLRFQVKQNHKNLNVVAFGLAASYGDLILGKPIDIAGFPEINFWKGEKSLQFNAQDIRLSD